MIYFSTKLKSKISDYDRQSNMSRLINFKIKAQKKIIVIYQPFYHSEIILVLLNSSFLMSHTIRVTV